MDVAYRLIYSRFTYPALSHMVEVFGTTNYSGKPDPLNLKPDIEQQFFTPMNEWCEENFGPPSIFKQWDNSPWWRHAYYFATQDMALAFVLRWS